MIPPRVKPPATTSTRSRPGESAGAATRIARRVPALLRNAVEPRHRRSHHQGDGADPQRAPRRLPDLQGDPLRRREARGTHRGSRRPHPRRLGRARSRAAPPGRAARRRRLPRRRRRARSPKRRRRCSRSSRPPRSSSWAPASRSSSASRRSRSRSAACPTRSPYTSSRRPTCPPAADSSGLRRRDDPGCVSSPLARALVLILALVALRGDGRNAQRAPAAPAAPQRSADPQPRATTPREPATAEIGGRSEDEWRDAALARQRAVASAEAALAACEAREAPAPYRDYAGYYRPAARPRDGYRWVEIKNCDDARLDLADAQRDLDDFEEQARRSAVPPGWMR